MNKLFIASNNKHKITEINEILKPAGGLMIYTSYKFGIRIDAEEDGNTLEENSFKKALKNYQVLNIPVISDDTGLYVDELNGEPGIFSARYAGIDSTYSENCSKLLSKMDTIPEFKRKAGFESVICLLVNEKEYYFFKGICKGFILTEIRGKNGFGYDPLFVPEGYDETFAELSNTVKNKISHRALALQKFKLFIDSYFQ